MTCAELIAAVLADRDRFHLVSHVKSNASPNVLIVFCPGVLVMVIDFLNGHCVDLTDKVRPLLSLRGQKYAITLVVMYISLTPYELQPLPLFQSVPFRQPLQIAGD